MDTEEKKQLAKNPKTTKEILVKLAKDTNWDVRVGVAYNPNIPEETLAELAQDDDWGVSSAAIICFVRSNWEL